MNRNVLKIIACISMLIDHTGLILFPGVAAFRLAGRIAMPIFAFFIGEGCLYTKNKKKYFLRVFILGIICQAVYVAESIVTKSDTWGYMNILLTFSLSIILCYAFINIKENYAGECAEKHKATVLFTVTIALLVLIEFFCRNSEDIIGTNIEFDYGVFGMTLPAFATVSKDKTKKLMSFSLAHTVMAYGFYGFNGLFLCALIPLVLLLFYNSEPGRKNLKYFFYLFYPLHLALLYCISFVL